ncbi:pyruvate:ferredoxin (flavodoxin) oxidoreductase [Megasphaera vaginalis (ex Srinivasan et al. 2021)]|uniref:Pyruvate synthase n=1 Tax=Megasphaera vaginalis (ex Srinivasan et al. 2021) TaxID=1111454 RepID=U7UH22_9FIRM|nr:pyruvate:ferredoxin (flavodoxin) oxidoreductase [Megasphaera vaginalis (ex Srinivasan et al. 2021)]ERT58169.1 pyruvate synthase [Megasphaera vaginalis (ex Srinivasan et al. 2021)]
MSKFKTMDGNEAAAWASYAFTEVAAIYPITPSSPMAEHVDDWAAAGMKNLFGSTVKVVEMQSEAGAAGAFHGSLQAGAMTTTYTASQGFLLMIPNMYKVAGELLPGVFHVAARALANHALSIFGDHQDVMSARASGCCLLAESNVQEVMDLAGVAHLAALKGRLPFINFFDGFRTSHEIQKVEVMDFENYRDLVDWDALNDFRKRALNPDAPQVRGTAENPDIYFQHCEANNKFYEAMPDIVEEYMDKISEITGRTYKPFNYVGAPDAERVIVSMGSLSDVVKQAVKYLVGQGEKVGAINVHLYRPFSAKHLAAVLPKTVKKIAVIDRTKEPGSLGEPLYLDIVDYVKESGLAIDLIGGRAGLGSKDVVPEDILPVFEELNKEHSLNGFTIGIVDDVTNLSLARAPKMPMDLTGLTSCKFWGFGSDGTVGANKSAIKIIGDHTDMYAQAYFAYDSKKSGGVTISHLRFGTQPIEMPYLIDAADYIACHRQSYVRRFDLLRGVKDGGTFMLNCTWTDEELEKELPAKIKRDIAKNHVKFYTLNGDAIGQKLGLGTRINMVMQAAFFALAKVIPLEDAVKYLKDSIVKSYGKKGQKVVDMNWAAVDAGVGEFHEVQYPASWADAVDEVVAGRPTSEYFENVAAPVLGQIGDDLKVSDFVGREDGTMPSGTSKFEKAGPALHVPAWDSEKCIGCTQCSFVCPHATIRPVLTTKEETAAAPAGYKVAPKAKSGKEYDFAIVVDQLDCLECGSCVNVCPVKALTMVPNTDEERAKMDLWYYGTETVMPKANPQNKKTVIGSQFETPLLEFSGACAGCGETPYVKLVTQLFGDRMMIANATGCSSIWGASAPVAPYTTNAAGHGPSWANSLFEDAAEFGLGMFIGVDKVRQDMAAKVEEAKAVASPELQAALSDWAANLMEGEGSRERADKVEALLKAEAAGKAILEEFLEKKQFLVKRSHWIIGGDGWSYDIGYGGVDHVLASDQDINVLVLDTEVYSNTGGQSSKATPTAAIAQFAASGKRTKKKDLGMMAISYGYVYVAQVSMGADKNQLMKAINEAEAYHGPSLVICYAPCINHGIRKGMGKSQEEEKLAVSCGYWDLFRYNPDLAAQGKNPFSLDSKEPDYTKFQEFLQGEVRYASLAKAFPDMAQSLYEKTEADAKARRQTYVRFQSGFEG